MGTARCDTGDSDDNGVRAVLVSALQCQGSVRQCSTLSKAVLIHLVKKGLGDRAMNYTKNYWLLG